MRIITPGVKPEDKIYKGKCGYCKTVFECTKAEGVDVYDRGDNFLRVTCPFCSHTTFAYERKDGDLIQRRDRNYWDGGLHSRMGDGIYAPGTK